MKSRKKILQMGKKSSLIFASILIILAGCKNMNKTQKGAVIGTAGGAAMGAIIGKAAGNTALGAIIGATVGGVTGAIIGKQMDKQAKEIKRDVPGAKVERVGEGIVVEFNEKILFGFDRSDLTNTAANNLNKLANRRANAVAAYLKTRGIRGTRLITKGYGESAPKYSNTSEDGRTQNRRVEFLITANEKMKADAKREAEKKG